MFYGFLVPFQSKILASLRYLSSAFVLPAKHQRLRQFCPYGTQGTSRRAPVLLNRAEQGATGSYHIKNFERNNNTILGSYLEIATQQKSFPRLGSNADRDNKKDGKFVVRALCALVWTYKHAVKRNIQDKTNTTSNVWKVYHKRGTFRTRRTLHRSVRRVQVVDNNQTLHCQCTISPDFCLVKAIVTYIEAVSNPEIMCQNKFNDDMTCGYI